MEPLESEFKSLLTGIQRKYGYDFTGYSQTSLARRLQSAIDRSGQRSPAEVLDRILNDPIFFHNFLSDITVNVTEMFRDPQFYLVLRQQVIPKLRSYPSIRIWHAGCATGEEAYSMAILLMEEGLYDRSVIYATDVSPRAIRQAKEGIYTCDRIRDYTANYQKSGGIDQFSKYYTADFGKVKMANGLAKNIVFSQHNLVTDDVFSEVQVVLCRNVLIYFGKTLQDKVLNLFHRSLVHRGYLCLGTQESVAPTKNGSLFESVVINQKIYRKAGTYNTNFSCFGP